MAAWLGLSDQKLRYLLYKLPGSERYVSFSIRKRNGAERRIDAPKKYLKRIQQRINRVIQIIAPPRRVAKGFVKGLNITHHASLHRGRNWVIVADLTDFFASINFGRVLGAFKARPFHLPEPVAVCLAQLCCHEGALPQGAPTSPALSNLVCRSLDRDLVKYANACRVTVSRYADDICFSTNTTDLPLGLVKKEPDGSFAPADGLVEIISKNGFAVNPRKFRVRSASQSQLVTGLTVNRQISMPRRWKRQLRVILNILRKHGDKKGLEIVSSWSRRGLRNRSTSKLENVVRGKGQFAKWMDGIAGTSFLESLHRGYPAHRAILPKIGKEYLFRIMAEGDTDLIHLRSALDWYKSKGEFGELRPRFENYSGDKGDTDLWDTLKRLAKVDVHEIVVGIFDCDNAPFMKTRAVSSGSFVRLGQTVYAVFLAPPDDQTPARFCIECLYRRSECTLVTAEGRRLFFGDEFDRTTGLDSSGRYRRRTPQNTSVVLSDRVERVSDGYSVLLSKMDFAQMVSVGAAPFSNIDFGGFRPTFSLLRAVLESADVANQHSR